MMGMAKVFLVLFPQYNVEGLIFSWAWPCVSSLLDFLFLELPGKTDAISEIRTLSIIPENILLEKNPLGNTWKQNEISLTSNVCKTFRNNLDCWAVGVKFVVVVFWWPLFNYKKFIKYHRNTVFWNHQKVINK